MSNVATEAGMMPHSAVPADTVVIFGSEPRELLARRLIVPKLLARRLIVPKLLDSVGNASKHLARASPSVPPSTLQRIPRSDHVFMPLADLCLRRHRVTYTHPSSIRIRSSFSRLRSY